MGPLFFFFITCWASMSSPSGISFLSLLREVYTRGRERQTSDITHSSFNREQKLWVKTSVNHALAYISLVISFLFKEKEKRTRDVPSGGSRRTAVEPLRR